jgi:hypothetical protein
MMETCAAVGLDFELGKYYLWIIHGMKPLGSLFYRPLIKFKFEFVMSLTQ